MGMFDTVHFNCPKCGAALEDQSKAGKCSMLDYNADSVPLAIAASIDGDSVFCGSCETEWKVSAGPVKRVACSLYAVGIDEGDD